MDDVTIREATAEDAAAIQRVARESWHAAYDDVLGADAVEKIVGEWYGIEGLRESVAREDGRFLLAETGEARDDETSGKRDDEEGDDEEGSDEQGSGEPDGEEEAEEGEVVGFANAVLRDGDGPAWLPRIYVHPDEWGEGIGSELLARVEAWLREADADRLRLAVIADNEVGNAFYEARGYEIVEEGDEEVFGVTFEEYVREKEL